MSVDKLYEIDESDDKYAIDKLKPGSEIAMEFFAKQITIFDAFSKYWQPRLELGKKCQNYLRRNIFTRGQRLKYKNVQNKWPIEPQEMKKVIYSMSGQINKMVRSGAVTMEDSYPPPNVAPPEVVNILIKWWENKLKTIGKKKNCLKDALVTGYPNWLLFDRYTGAGGLSQEMEVTLLPWDSTFCSPHFMIPDGGDIEELIIIFKKTKSQLLSIFPERKKACEAHESMLRSDPGLQSQTLQYVNPNLSADTRNNVIFDMAVNQTLKDDTGLYTIVQRFFPVKKTKKVYINEQTGDVQELPENWEDWRKMQWEAENPEFNIEHTDRFSTMWVSTVGANGFCWDNDKHWFQHARNDMPEQAMLPAVPLIVNMDDKIPVGIGEDMLPLILMKAVCKTEGLNEVRQGTNTMVWYPEGAMRHPSRITHEMSQTVGAGILKKGHTAQEIKTEIRKPNTTFFEFDDRLSEELANTHNVNPAVQGQHAPRQSLVAKDREIEQSMIIHSPYVESYTTFNMNVAQMFCYMIPHFMNQYKLVEIDDEFGGKMSAEINVQERNAQGLGSIIANDILSVKWRIIPVPGDDSPTARQRDMVMFAELLEAFGNSLMSLMNTAPMFVASFFSSLPNRYSRECGKHMYENAMQMQQAQQQEGQAEQQFEMTKLQTKRDIEMAKILLPRLMMKTDAKDIQEAPMGFQVFANYINALQQRALAPSPQAQQAQVQPQMPEQQSQAQPQMSLQ